MKVILSQDVPNLGQTGETVKVADGYAQNYLLPRKMAVSIHSGSAKQVEHDRRIIQGREEKRRAHLARTAEAIAALSIDFKVRAGDEDRIFGSVTAAQIADKLAELGHKVERRAVTLEEPIRALGIYAVPVRLATGIEATLKVWVSAMEEDLEQEEEQRTAQKEEETP